MIALAAATLLMASCNKEKNSDSETTDAQQTEVVVAEEATVAEEALEGAWTATMPAADSGVPFTYTLTLKEGNKYDLMQAHPEVAADKAENVTDADYTREGNILTLADGRKLEYADGVLYWHNDEGNRAAVEGTDHYIFRRVVVAE